MLKHWILYVRQMGPAWIISAVACGPATLASVCIAGASYGFTLLWVVILSAVFGATAQYLAARIGIIEGRGIIGTTEQRLGAVWAWFLAIETPWWGIPYALAIGLALVRGGYRLFESLCKALVVFVVCCFIITALQANISFVDLARGIIPSVPGGIDSALMIAAIMGGAVHITIIGMHTYYTNARKWTRKDLRLARFDNTPSMGFDYNSRRGEYREDGLRNRNSNQVPRRRGNEPHCHRPGPGKYKRYWWKKGHRRSKLCKVLHGADSGSQACGKNSR